MDSERGVSHEERTNIHSRERTEGGGDMLAS